MLCTKGHNNAEDAKFCSNCGADTFQPSTQSAVLIARDNTQQRVTTNGLAIASMVLGICWVYWVGSILALVFGYVARRQIRQTRQNGDGMAIAGMVLGWVGVAALVVVIIAAIAASPNG
jgi:uncharacterized membrane protein YvbJ